MSINRRDTLKMAAGAGAAACVAGLPFAAQFTGGAAGAGAAFAQQPGRVNDDAQGAGFYRFKIGDLDAALISDGTFPFATPYPTLGGNAPEADVKRAFADAFIPYDKVLGHVNVLALFPSGDVILVDAGCGPAYSPTTGKLLQHLANLGVDAGDVSVVIITHAHRDHIGGLLDADDKPVFRHARYLAHRDEIAFWAGGNPNLSRSTAPPAVKKAMTAAAARTFEAIGDVTTGFDDKAGLHAGIRVLGAPGHTPGHTALELTNGDAQLLYITDAIHHPAINLPHPDWHVAFDADPVRAAKSRRAILDRAAADRVLVSGSHLPFPGIGHVRAAGNGFEWVPAVWEW